MILLDHRGCFEMARITEVKAVTRGGETVATPPEPDESAELGGENHDAGSAG